MDADYRLVIVGAGLAGMSALRAGAGKESTLVLDYQAQCGGFLRPLLPAKGYEDAWELVQNCAMPRGVALHTEATAVGLMPGAGQSSPHILLVRTRHGTEQMRAERVLIASGALEKTREASQMPGARPAGVITPIFVHEMLARGYLPGRRVIVYGSSHYAIVTAERLAQAGAQVTVIAPPESTSQPAESRVHVEPPAELVDIIGFPRVECVRFQRDGVTSDYEADAIVYAMDRIANTHWLKGSGIETTEDGAVRVDADFQTNIPGIYAAGAVVSPNLDHSRSITMGEQVARVLTGGTR